MKTISAKSAGFCWGVRRAVKTAEKTIDDAQGAVFTDGPLIHNRRVMEELAKKGIKSCDDPASLPDSATLIIRAHGISPKRRQMLEAAPPRIVDATCPDVERIQKIVAERSKQGFSIVILGEGNHAEVIGLRGYAAGAVYVISGPDEAVLLPQDLSRVCLVAQSTQSPELFEKVADLLRSRYGDIAIENTICRATRARQGELKQLAGMCDAIVVVGSPESANTVRLAKIASKLRPTIMVDDAAQLKESEFKGFSTVGITAGASTPDFVISQVENKLRKF